jgi:antitoxin ParD1/3/4
MIVKNTLSFTDRHHRLLSEKVAQGVFATQSAAVAAALEQMMQDEEDRAVALEALAQEIRARMETPRDAFIEQDDAFAPARASIEAARAA